MFSLLLASEATRLPLALLIVFATAKLAGEILERMNMPGIVGEILAGVLIGPSVLNWVEPNATLATLAEIGVMFLLFRVGLEVKAQDLLKMGPIATLVACCGVVVPFALGWAILSLWGRPQIEAVFVGAAMVATSVGITARVLAAKGLLNKRASQIILAAAVIDDVLGLLALALVSSVAKGKFDVLEIALSCTLACGFVVVVAKCGNGAMERILPHLGSRMRAEDAEFTLAMVVLFSLSLVAVYTGVAAIVGAFLAGMALSGTASQRVRDLSHGTTELLVPFFLAGIGLHVDLGAFLHPETMLLTGMIIVAAVLSKFIGCGLASWKLGRADALRIGFGMVPRGEVGMVVAQIGLTLGVVSRPIYGVVVAMAVASTIIAPPLVAYAYRDAARPA